MIESVLEDLVRDKAEAAGWIVRKVRWIGRRNCMDRFFLKDGRIVLIEMKKPGEKPNPNQQREIDLFIAAGAEVHVCDNHLAALRVLEVDYA